MSITNNLLSRFLGVKIATMQGMRGFFRLRVGGYRAILTVDDKEKATYIQAIGPRGDVYKKRD